MCIALSFHKPSAHIQRITETTCKDNCFTFSLRFLYHDSLDLEKGITVKRIDQQKKYHSYLLRLWLDETNGEQIWRISLENPFTRERRWFASLKDLCMHLRERMQVENEKQEVVDE